MCPLTAPALADCVDRVAAAKYLNISPATLAAWATSGRYRDVLRPFRLGKRVWYSREALDAFIELQMSSSSSAK